MVPTTEVIIVSRFTPSYAVFSASALLWILRACLSVPCVPTCSCFVARASWHGLESLLPLVFSVSLSVSEGFLIAQYLHF